MTAVSKKENYSFEYRFSKEEIEQKSKQLAKTCEERNELEDEKKSVMSEFKAKIDGKTAEINVLCNHINTGKTHLTKTCDVQYDYDRGLKTYWWDGNVVGTEKMSQKDYQAEAQL